MSDFVILKKQWPSRFKKSAIEIIFENGKLVEFIAAERIFIGDLLVINHDRVRRSKTFKDGRHAALNSAQEGELVLCVPLKE